MERVATGPVRILTVDDYRPFLDAARRVVAATAGFESAGEVTGGEEAFAAIDESEPQLALIDVRMPQIDGIEAARRIKATHPAVLVILISALDPGQLPGAVRDCGAAAVIRKQDLNPRSLRELWQAVRPA